MTDSVFTRAKAVLAEVVELPAVERPRQVERLCGDDDELRSEVLSLLAFDGSPDERLTAVPGARAVLGGLAGAAAAHAVPPAMDGLGPGVRVGGFTLGPRLGAGGMGVVYEATQDEPRRTVALKLLAGGPVSDELRSRFRHEVQVLGRLEHPAIASLYEAGVAETADGPRPFFAMPLVRGVPLTHWVREQRPPPEVVVQLLADVCDAVAHAHERGVVHRDLKPANILVSEDGRPTVLDFGVARLTDAHTRLTSLRTEAGQVLGTLPYMSPEQVSGSVDEVDARSDVYSLGVLLFEALTGELPLNLTGMALPSAALAIQRTDPRRLGAVDPGLAGDLEVLVDKALSKERGRRYADAAALGSDLRRHLAGLPVEARPLSAVGYLTRTMRRHRALAASLGLALVALTVALVISLDQTRRARQATAAQVREADRSRVVAAAAAFDARDPRLAAQHLQAVTRGGRGWEWRHQWQRLDGAVLELPAESGRVQAVFAADGAGWVELHNDGRVRWRRFDDGGVTHELALDATSLARALLSRDGTRAAALVHVEAAEMHTVVLWDTATGERLAEFAEPDPVLELGLSSDGRSLGWITRNQVSLWTAGAAAPTRFGGGARHADGCRPVVHEGSLVAGGRYGTVLVFDARGDVTRPARRLRKSGTRTAALCLSADGARLAFSAQDGVVRVADTAAEESLVAGIHQGPVTAMAFLPDGRRLLSAGEDGLLLLSDVDSGRDLDSWSLGEHELRSLDVDGEGCRVLATTASRALLVWDLERSAEGDVLSGHTSYVYDLEVLPDGRAVSASWDGTLRWWDTRDGRALETRELSGRVGTVRAAPDGRSVVAQVGWGLTVLHDDPERPDVELQGGIRPSSAVHWIEGGAALLVGPARRVEEGREALRRFDPATGALLSEHPTPGEVVRRLALPPGEERVATGSMQGEVVLWSWPDMGARTTLGSHTAAVTEMAFSPDGTRLLSASKDGAVQVWNVAEARLELRLTGSPGEVWDAVWSPDGTRVATGCHDGIVRLYDTSDGALVARLRGHSDYVHALAFTPDGHTLVTGSGDGTLQLWHTRSLRERLALDAVDRDPARELLESAHDSRR